MKFVRVWAEGDGVHFALALVADPLVDDVLCEDAAADWTPRRQVKADRRSFLAGGPWTAFFQRLPRVALRADGSSAKSRKRTTGLSY